MVPPVARPPWLVVLCCYTTLHPKTAASLPPAAHLVDVSGDPYGYWHEIDARWSGESDLLVVEHDIELHAGVIPGVARCSSGWCTYPYRGRPDHGNIETMALGCTRFSAALQRRVPFPQRQQWWSLGGQIALTLVDGCGLAPCVHEPPVAHWRAP